VKSIIQKRVPITWFLLTAILSGAALIIWKLLVIDAPPASSVYIVTEQQGDRPSATITQRPSESTSTSQPTAAPAPTELALLNTLPDAATDTPKPNATTRLIAVYVSGAVAAPGVYTLPEDSRVQNAVAAAGGTLPEADLNRINLAAHLADEDHVIVYRQGEAAQPTEDAGAITARTPTMQTETSPRPQRTPIPLAPDQPSNVTPAVKININTATAVELEQIPGIGPALAQRIISDRQANGPFNSLQDLTRISGIKEGVLARLRPYVTVAP
jgi:competence protein ComEA